MTMKPIHHTAKKRFGQNFLHDPAVITRIVNTINPKKNDPLIEIGPGPGALTQPLLQKTGAMRVIELDRDVIPKLKMFCLGDGELDVIEADALSINFSELKNNDARLRIVGNLPYNISTPILFHLFSHIDAIEDMHFMLQKEVVERLVAPHGSKTYGRLSIMAQYFCRCELMFIVKPGAFTPAPKVDSAIIRLQPKRGDDFRSTDTNLMNRIVTSAFSLRRKTIRNSLKAFLSLEDFENLSLSPTERAENLSLDTFITITEYCLAKS